MTWRSPPGSCSQNKSPTLKWSKVSLLDSKMSSAASPTWMALYLQMKCSLNLNGSKVQRIASQILLNHTHGSPCQNMQAKPQHDSRDQTGLAVQSRQGSVTGAAQPEPHIIATKGERCTRI